MAYKKYVQGRSYPYLYNLTMMVGSYNRVNSAPKKSEGDEKGEIMDEATTKEKKDQWLEGLKKERNAAIKRDRERRDEYERQMREREKERLISERWKHDSKVAYDRQMERYRRGMGPKPEPLKPPPPYKPNNSTPLAETSKKEEKKAIPYGPNKRDDVMLVQYLLKRVYQQGHRVQPPLNQTNGTAQLKVDGLYGPKTQRAITDFQLEMRRKGQSIATDGCVDPERGDSTTSSISKTGYTISWLNQYFWSLYPELAQNIALDPECPPELKQSLSQKATAA